MHRLRSPLRGLNILVPKQRSPLRGLNMRSPLRGLNVLSSWFGGHFAGGGFWLKDDAWDGHLQRRRTSARLQYVDTVNLRWIDLVGIVVSDL